MKLSCGAILALSAGAGAAGVAAGKSCTPKAGGSPKVDDVPAIHAAIKACSSGTVVIPKGTTYHVNSQLSLAGCRGCTLQLDGTLQVSADVGYWNNKGRIIYISGVNGATITGSGTIDGNGQASWDYYAKNRGINLPFLVQVDGSANVVVSGITLRNAPMFHVVTSGNSHHIRYSHLTLHSVSKSKAEAMNTDAFDIGASSWVTVEHSTVTNSDDCVVLKPGSDHITVQGMTCTGSHGLSVGSLADGPGVNELVSNSIFRDSLMIDSLKAAGIKYWPGGPHHGTGLVSNVTWQNIQVQNCNYAFQVATCYNSRPAACDKHPSTGRIEGVTVADFTGFTSRGYGTSAVANIDCSRRGSCGIKMRNFGVTSPDKKNQVLCANTPASLGVGCTAGAWG
ncbi:uncharacterized protein UV8b_03451 [Ustilaginoidea virens]|uniref:Glycoside hydrolase family 28 protein n=1 Tax=Ustilaginoidea virens TaxID=1159556 RepID=A0A1B5KRQ2_USTVR|nr:uncharacterized protein UV8b_03451 [Ustilaginoidea virens]QUC19210.1 hypothetical protein UV8b_03451 [Ustilaginoidea virens]GAO13076.1 hypothetical protein UVI_02024380 [Ustilaginoidea virens]